MAIKDALTGFIGRNGAGKPSQEQLDTLNNQRRAAMGRSISKGFLVAANASNPVLEKPLLLRFQFNPTEWSKSKAINYGVTEVPGAINPLIEFIAGKETTYTMELMFYAPTEDDLRGFTVKERARISEIGFVQYQLECLALMQSSETRFSPPPSVTLFFPRELSDTDLVGESGASKVSAARRSKGISIMAVIKDAKVTVLAMDRFLRPMHAKVDLTLIRVAPYAKKKLPVKRTVVSMQDAVALKPDRTYGGPVVELTIEYLKEKHSVTTWAELARAAGADMWSCFLLNPLANPRIMPLLESYPFEYRHVTRFVKVPKKGAFANEKSPTQKDTQEHYTEEYRAERIAEHYTSTDTDA